MKLVIDTREKDLIKLLKALNSEQKKQIDIDVKPLDLGDVIFYDKSGKEILVIERKSVNDLAGSIRDGRYNEQSLRLTNWDAIHNHNIVYLIEGQMRSLNSKYNKITPDILYSTMCSLFFHKGFSIFRSNDVMETANVILRFFYKIQKETKRKPYYDIIQPEQNVESQIENSKNQESFTQSDSKNGEKEKNKIVVDKIENIKTGNKISNNTNLCSKCGLGVNSQEYVSVIKKVKKDNITPENIGAIILSQIPGISSVTSLTIMDKFGSLYDLMLALKEDGNCMNGLTYTTKSGQIRRISHKSIESVKKFLLYKRETGINIDV
jgi:ERCC4-type nuclease